MLKFKDYFCGNKISDYGRQSGRVDYRTFAAAFDAVLNNDIITKFDFEQVSGVVDNSEEIEELEDRVKELESGRVETEDEIYFVDDDGEEITGDAAEEIDNEIAELKERIEELEDEQDEIPEVFQWFIIDNAGAEICQEFNEIVYYCEEIDLYLWGVTHYGTSWDYVLTDIECEREEV